MRILATYNLKGGVGKTAATVNLSYLAARAGYRTLVWDLDPQGAATFYFRVKPKVKGGTKKILGGKRSLESVVKGTDFEGLDLIPSDFSYRNMDLAISDAKKPSRQLLKLMRPLSDEYDFLFLDCAPSISVVSENIFYAADALLTPLIPTTLSLRSYRQILRYFAGKGLDRMKLLPFFSMVDRRKRLHREIVENLPRENPEVLNTGIPYASAVERMGIMRAPLGSFEPRSPAAIAYRKLWEEIGRRL